MSKPRVQISTVKLSPNKQPEKFVSVFSMIPRRKFTGDSSTSVHHSPPLQQASSVTTSNHLNDNHSVYSHQRTTLDYSKSKYPTYNKNHLRDRNKNAVVEKSKLDSTSNVVRVPLSKKTKPTSIPLNEQPHFQKASFGRGVPTRNVHMPSSQQATLTSISIDEQSHFLKASFGRGECVPSSQQATPTSIPLDEQPHSQKTSFSHGEPDSRTEASEEDYQEERESVKSIISRLESISKTVDCKPKPTVAQRGVCLTQTSNSNKNKVSGVCAPQRNECHIEERLKSAKIKSKSISEDAFNVTDSISNNDSVSTRPKNDLRVQNEKSRFQTGIAVNKITEISTKISRKSCDTNNNGFHSANIKHQASDSHVASPSSLQNKTLDGERSENLTSKETESEKDVRNMEPLSSPEARDQSENHIQKGSKFKDDVTLFNSAKDSNQKLIGSLSTLLDNQYLSQSFASFRNRRKHWFQNNKYSGHHDNSNVLQGDYSNRMDGEANDVDLFLDNQSLNKAFHVFRVRRRNSDFNSTNKCNVLH